MVKVGYLIFCITFMYSKFSLAFLFYSYDIDSGTKIGITSFSSSASVDKDIIELTDQNREEFVHTIDSLKADGGTCMGDGLMKGMDVSKHPIRIK